MFAASSSQTSTSQFSASQSSVRTRNQTSNNHCDVCHKIVMLPGLNVARESADQRRFDIFFNLEGDEYLYRSKCSECLPNGCLNCKEVRSFMYSLRPYQQKSPVDMQDRIAAIKTYAEKRGVEVIFYPEFDSLHEPKMDIYYCRSCRDTNSPMYCGDFRFAPRHSCSNCSVEEDPEFENIYSAVAQEYDDYFDLGNGGKICRKRRRKNRKVDRVPKVMVNRYKEKTTGAKRYTKPKGPNRNPISKETVIPESKYETLCGEHYWDTFDDDDSLDEESFWNDYCWEAVIEEPPMTETSPLRAKPELVYSDEEPFWRDGCGANPMVGDEYHPCTCQLCESDISDVA